MEIQGAPARGYTSGQALAALEQVFAETMPKEMSFAYSSLSYQEKIAPPAGPTFIMAIVCVFLLLAAMYESWRLPWAVLLGSPLVALGAFFGVWLMGYDNNVYVQVGLVMLIGLAAKNAILIVEFAKAKHEEGASLEEAALESARLRFRPILMTAFAFILGVVPLMLRERGRRGRSERDGHRGVLGHADRNGAGRVHHSRQLHFRRGSWPPASGPHRGQPFRARIMPPPGPAPSEDRTDATDARRPGDRPRPRGLHGGPRLSPARGEPSRQPTGGRRRRPRRMPVPSRDLEWWKVFQDEQLQALIRTALEQNYDLRVAATRILQARSQVVIARSFQFPTADVGAAAP